MAKEREQSKHEKRNIMNEFKRKKACRKYLKIKGICICVNVMIGL